MIGYVQVQVLGNQKMWLTDIRANMQRPYSACLKQSFS